MEIIIVSVCAWAVTQFIKVIVGLVRKKQFDFRTFVTTGGMPSSHSAIVSALATSVAIADGIKSVTFAISTVLAFIVMYDAAGLRRSVGQQAQVLNRILKELRERRSIAYFEKDLRELIGHSALQVIVGACIGIAISYTWFMFIA
ncbi:MAG TPA: divergent PAP2 family protein [Dehalococcoidales bacterium]|nr:divergent PAP2 family protein [Dehalococcoidales bacterium]